METGLLSDPPLLPALGECPGWHTGEWGGGGGGGGPGTGGTFLGHSPPRPGHAAQRASRSYMVWGLLRPQLVDVAAGAAFVIALIAKAIAAATCYPLTRMKVGVLAL
jgi:hypothetical protein